MPPRRRRCWGRRRRSRTRAHRGGQDRRRRSARARSQPHRILRPAGGGRTETALAALPTHLDAWPRDALVLGTTAFTNGLIGSSGRAGQKHQLPLLLDGLAPNYGDDWWFTAHHGMALSENGQHAAARPKIDRSLGPKSEQPLGGARPQRIFAMRRAIQTRPAPSWRPGSPPIRATGVLQPPELASRARRPRGRRCGGGVPAVPGSLFADVHSGPPRARVNDRFRFYGAGNSPGIRATPKHGAYT